MKTCSAVGLVALLVGCHLDKLVNAPGGGNPPSQGPVSRLVFASAPTSGRAGQPLAAVRIALVDSAGRTVSSADSLISVSLDANPSGATLSGTDTAHAVNGAATFANLRIDKADSGYTLRAQATGLPPAGSPAFAVMPGPPTVLRFTVQPSATMQNKPITPAVQVSAFDSVGNAATNFTGSIHVAKGTDGSALKNAKLGGTTDVAAAAGVATFSDLTIDQPGTGYTLTAALGSATPATTSAAFDITTTPPPPPGSLTVTTTTTGADQDPNGYTVTVDGTVSQTIADNGSVTFSNLAPGSHTVTVSDVAANCSVSGGSSHTVTITSGATATTAFTVSCAATTGGITVTTTTTGSSLPTGYSVAVDGGAGQAIGINASVTISGLTPGSHAVVLSGVPANCTVANGTSRTVTVTAGGTASTAFSITCTALPGDLSVSTNTTGQSVPTSGYTVTLDGTSSRTIGTTDNTTFTGLPAGSHSVVLSGVASNCTVASGTSRTVNVPAGGSASASFSITCTALPGNITVSATTTGSNLPTSGYTVTVDGATSQAIGINGNASFTGVAAGSHTVVLSGVPANCTVTNGDTRTVNVPAGGTGSAAFTISCVAPPPPNQAPVVSVSGGTVAVGVGYGLNASFTDPDNGPWTYTVNWGDGTTDSGTAASPGPISGTHTYLVTGTYQITVTVTDNLRASGSASAALTVIL